MEPNVVKPYHDHAHSSNFQQHDRSHFQEFRRGNIPDFKFKRPKLLSPHTVKVETQSMDDHTNSTAFVKSEPQCDFTFEEITCLKVGNQTAIHCCHFSSNGQILAGTGDKKTVRKWRIQTKDYSFTDTKKGHSDLVTDVRFHGFSCRFATSSMDRTVKVWDTQYSTPLCTIVGNKKKVLSLDFHPRQELLYSCYGDDEIRVWDAIAGDCAEILKVPGATTTKLRFSPCFDSNMLATASGNVINVINVGREGLTTDVLFKLEGHTEQVVSICWNKSGEYIGSVSGDKAQVWSLATGESIGVLHSTDSFTTCAFHPRFADVLIIGDCEGILEIWSPTDVTKRMKVKAHKHLINDLTDCSRTGMIASASEDHCVKLWK